MQYAISYSRFSTGRQKHGTSLTRQLQQVDEYCRAHNLTLLESFHDAGKSGFHGKNLEAGGQLKLLLDKINDGTIPKGTRLLVEQTDRLTRQAVLEGLQIVQQLIFAGIVVVTLDDNQEYDKDSDFGKLVLLLARLQRGHDESKAKSERLGFAWKKKAEQMQAGQLPKMRMPFWLKRQGDEVEIIAEWTEVIDKVFQDSIDGHGCAEIAKGLNRQGVKTKAGANWTASAITQLLRNKRLIGWHQRSGSKELFKVYPAVLSIERFNEAQKAMDTRVRSKGNSQKWSSALSGLTHCGACGSVLKFSGQAKYRTGVCRAAVDGGSECANKRSLRYKALVLGIVAALKHGLAEKLLPPVQSDTSERELLEHDLDTINGQITNLIAAIKQAPSVTELAVELSKVQQQREQVKETLSTLASPIDTTSQRLRLHLMASRDIPELVDMVLDGVKEAANKLNILLHSIGGVEVTLLDGVASVGDTKVWIEHKTIHFSHSEHGSGIITKEEVKSELKTIEYGSPENPRSITTEVSIQGEPLGGGYRLEYSEEASEPFNQSELYKNGEVDLDKFTFMNDRV